MVDVSNSFEVAKKGQMLYLKLGKADTHRALLKVIFLPEDKEEYKQKESEIEEEWAEALKLNESDFVVHCLGREYCSDDKKRKRCEILCQYFTTTLDQIQSKCTKLKILMLMTQIAQGLAHAHANNIIHGNISSSCVAIEEDRAILKDFSFCRYTHSQLLTVDNNIPTNFDSYFIPPERINKDFKQKSNENCWKFWTKKQDVYMWAMLVLYFLGMRDVMKKLHSKKFSISLYDAEVAKVKRLFITCNSDIKEEGISIENIGSLIESCLSISPLSRPSIGYVLQALEIVDKDVEPLLKSLCHSCGYHRARLHQLSCQHNICKKCLYKIEGETKKEEEDDEDEDKKELIVSNEIKIKACKVCDAQAELNIFNLKCGCRYPKKSIVEQVNAQTEGKILRYDMTTKKFLYPLCEDGHSITLNDMFLLFGEECINKIKKERKIEADNSKNEHSVPVPTI